MTRLSKDVRGNWSAVSSFPVEGRPNLTLNVRTIKVFSGSLVTEASVTVKDDVFGFSSYRVYLDFDKRLALSRDRCTQGNVSRQHEDALSGLDTLKREVEAHYKTLDEREAA